MPGRCPEGRPPAVAGYKSGPPDDDETERVDGGADRSYARIIAAERGEEKTGGKNTKRGGKAA
jgi:hypothetical protein